MTDPQARAMTDQPDADDVPEYPCITCGLLPHECRCPSLGQEDTDQPDAAPTPGPYKCHNTSINRHFWLISAAMPVQRKTAISGSRIRIAEIKHWGDKEPGESEANARLIAAAPETAAERDGLKAANEHFHTYIGLITTDIEALSTERDRLLAALRQAEEGAAIIVGQITAPQDGLSSETTAWVIRQAVAISNRARAALDEARKP